MKAVQQLIFGVKWDDLDILMVDMPPGTGDVQLSLCQLAKIDGKLLILSICLCFFNLIYK